MAVDTKLTEERLMEWLRDAHAMEAQGETMLTSLVGRLGDHPELQQRVRQHIDETRDQARHVHECIERHGETISPVKDLGAVTLAWMQGIAGMFMTDEIVKVGIATCTFEHFEIAAYRNLAEAARICGDGDAQSVCEKILDEELAMATWLEQNIPGIVRTYFGLVGNRAGMENRGETGAAQPDNPEQRASHSEEVRHTEEVDGADEAAHADRLSKR